MTLLALNPYLCFKENKDMVYIIRQNDYVKIGCTRDVRLRLGDLQCGSPYELTVLLLIEGGFDEEKVIHEKFKKDLIRGEWFMLSQDIRDFIVENKKLDRRYEEGLLNAEDLDLSVQTKFIRNINSLRLRNVSERLGITIQSVREIEQRELHGTVSVNALRRYGEALGYDLIYKFIKPDITEE